MIPKKSIVRRPRSDRSQTYNTYLYEPLGAQDAIDKSVHWSLGLPDRFLTTVGDMRLLPKTLDAAKRFEKRPSDKEMNAIVDEFDVQTIRCSMSDLR